jgi:hypothetical protein
LARQADVGAEISSFAAISSSPLTGLRLEAAVSFEGAAFEGAAFPFFASAAGIRSKAVASPEGALPGGEPTALLRTRAEKHRERPSPPLCGDRGPPPVLALRPVAASYVAHALMTHALAVVERDTRPVALE